MKLGTLTMRIAWIAVKSHVKAIPWRRRLLSYGRNMRTSSSSRGTSHRPASCLDKDEIQRSIAVEVGVTEVQVMKGVRPPVAMIDVSAGGRRARMKGRGARRQMAPLPQRLPPRHRHRHRHQYEQLHQPRLISWEAWMHQHQHQHQQQLHLVPREATIGLLSGNSQRRSLSRQTSVQFSLAPPKPPSPPRLRLLLLPCPARCQTCSRSRLRRQHHNNHQQSRLRIKKLTP
mmetsp:Transcript_83402/g.210248  ORF Transcript_83402/g.210248 Transcript_83402/m.210248 type:complete len:230 (+) Transcript_83402:458-1147(+)